MEQANAFDASGCTSRVPARYSAAWYDHKGHKDYNINTRIDMFCTPQVSGQDRTAARDRRVSNVMSIPRSYNVAG
jgi:hypothetical protein